MEEPVKYKRFVDAGEFEKQEGNYRKSGRFPLSSHFARNHTLRCRFPI